MTEKKYSKHIIPAPIAKPKVDGYKFEALYAKEGQVNANCTMTLNLITEEFTEHGPHTHDGYQILCFIGGDLRNVRDFDAEVQIKLGEEGEIHTITSPSIVTIPPGLVHCPLTFKRIGKPILFLEICLQEKYKTIGEGAWDPPLKKR